MVRRLGPLVVLAVAAVASPGMPHPGGDLVARLPQAYANYCDQLKKEGRADELTMSANQKLDEWIDGKWFGPRDSTWTEVKREVQFPNAVWGRTFPTGTGRLRDSLVLPADDGYECRDIVSARFQIALEESLLFTVGRVPERCNETPLMIRKTDGGWGSEFPMPDLFNYNVIGLWFTRSYLVFDIRADYELGGSREGLAFWHLENGWIHSLVAETHVTKGIDETLHLRTDPTQGLGVYLRDLSHARLSESQELIFLQDGSLKLAFWPAKQEWMLIP